MQANKEHIHSSIQEREMEIPEILNQVAFLRVWQIADCRKPGVDPLLPISRTTFLKGVKDGIYPQPIKCGHSSLWAAEDIKKLVIQIKTGSQG